MTAKELMLDLHKLCHFMSTERPGTKASSSEVIRWLNNKAVSINSYNPSPQELVQFPVQNLVLFPKSDKRRCTLV